MVKAILEFLRNVHSTKRPGPTLLVVELCARRPKDALECVYLIRDVLLAICFFLLVVATTSGDKVRAILAGSEQVQKENPAGEPLSELPSKGWLLERNVL